MDERGGGTAVEGPAGSFRARPTGTGRSRSRWPLRIGLALVLVLLLAGNAFAYDLYRFQQRYDGRILPGAVVGGVDVSGMTRAEAVAALEDELAPHLDRRVTLRWNDLTWDTSLRELGAVTDVEDLVDAALVTSAAATWTTLSGVRWRDAQVPYSAEVSVDQSRRPIAAMVRQIAGTIDRQAVDAQLHHDRSRIWIDQEIEGRRVLVNDTADALLTALRDPAGPDELDVAVAPVEPEVRAADFRQVLFLRQQDHRLDLYLEGQLAHTYVVATGTNDYPTPTGTYEVTLKRHMPTWVNPDPTGWGRTMPARIGPGPNNPLGVRALNWSAPGAIRFHGTAAVDSLGRDASHGCVRLSNSDIVHLYDRVDEGATIVSVR